MLTPKRTAFVPLMVSNYCLAGKFQGSLGGGAGCVSISGDAGREAENLPPGKMPVLPGRASVMDFFPGE